jgi:hypothetical protein
MKQSGHALVVVMALAAGACATTEFKSTWKDPSVTRLDTPGEKVAGFVVTRNASLRRSAEDTLASALRARGVNAVAGYQLIPDETLQNRDALRRKLDQMGIDQAVVMRVVDRRQEVTYEPPMGPYYGSFYGYWDYGWAAVSDPGYLHTNTLVSVETLVYSVSQDKLLWGGVSETTDPSKLDSFIHEIVDQAAKEMKKQGLISGNKK